jgi:hypothetical protein
MTDKNTGGYEGVSRSFNVCGEVVPREREENGDDTDPPFLE